ncbi:Histone deacetylase-like amidohydrolase [Thalassocella blandensis]|nr:Histone deacetylase-like amidohydrolase [Thalassocella blandensis]
MHTEQTLYVTHSDCLKHEIPEHPESSKRLSAIEAAINTSNIASRLQRLEAPEIQPEDVLRVHSQKHLDHIIQNAPIEGITSLDADTHMCSHTYRAARLAAGAVLFATNEILHQRGTRAFCAVRPPGHHAERDRPMGFCLFNNIAIATAFALHHKDIERAVIIDFDVHHGNGTENIFMKDSRVLICSSYESPLYPDTGCESIPGHIINLPFSAGTEGDTYTEQVLRQWIPAIEEFKPDIMFISAGFDAHKDDPLANMMLEDQHYYTLTKALCEVAQKVCGGKIISSLEGGYEVNALSRSVLAHVKALTEY